MTKKKNIGAAAAEGIADIFPGNYPNFIHLIMLRFFHYRSIHILQWGFLLFHLLDFHTSRS